MADEKTAARREKRIAARRTQILDAAAKVFAEKGFARATTREIADAADVSEGTIYNYFASKEDLLIGVMTRLSEAEEQVMQATPDVLEQVLSSDPRDFFSAAQHERQSFVLQNRTMLQAILSEMLVNQEFSERYYEQIIVPATELTEQHLQARVEQGQVRPVSVPLLARYLFAIHLGLLGLLIAGDPFLQSEWESDELVEELIGFIFDGIGAREETTG